LFQHVLLGLQGRLSIWHVVPLKPCEQEQIYPSGTLALFIQVLLFWHGWSMSHGEDVILQLGPIWYWSLHDGTKNGDGDGGSARK
jgi:hypothetical protein